MIYLFTGFAAALVGFMGYGLGIARGYEWGRDDERSSREMPR